jgi:hypothetical protein
MYILEYTYLDLDLGFDILDEIRVTVVNCDLRLQLYSSISSISSVAKYK